MSTEFQVKHSIDLPAQRSSRRQVSWLRVVISVGLLVWLCRSINWRDLAKLSLHVKWELVLVACLLHAANRCLTTTKWQVLLRSKGLLYPFPSLLSIVWISNFLGHFLPAAVGGDSVRMLTMARRSRRAPEAIATVLVERLTGVVSLAVLAVLGGLWSYGRWGQSAILLLLVCPLVALLGGLVLIWSAPGNQVLSWVINRFHRWPGYGFLVKVHEAVKDSRKQPVALVIALGISAVLQFSRVTIVYLLAKALGIQLFFGEALVLIPATLFVAMLPISIWGLGVQEGAFVVLLRLAGIGTLEAFALSLLSRLTALLANVPGGLLLLMGGLYKSGHSVGKEPEQAIPSPQRPLTVLQLTDKLGYSGKLHGVGRFFANVIPAFDPVQVRVIACVFREHDGLDTWFHEQGVEVYRIQRGKFDPLAALDIWKLVRRERVQVMHLHGYGATTIGRIIGLLSGVPTVIHQHDTDARFPWYVGLLDSLLSVTTERAIAVSEDARRFCARKRKVAIRRVVVLPNAVPLARYHASTSPANFSYQRKALGLPVNGTIVGTVSRFREEKGIQYLIEAFARIQPFYRNASLVIVGDGPLRANLERLADTLGIRHSVYFLGFREDVPGLLQSFDVFVLPSITEGSPLALLEAMATGKPVIASGVGGIKEVLEDGVNGRLVPAKDPSALAEALMDLLSDPKQAVRLGEAAQEASSEFGVEGYVERLERMYRMLLRIPEHSPLGTETISRPAVAVTVGCPQPNGEVR